MRQRLPLEVRRIKYTLACGTDLELGCQVIEMTRFAGTLMSLGLLMAFPCVSAWGQAPSGPIPPKPGVEVQLPPKNAQAQVKVQVALVNTPVTVRNSRGDMVHDLEAGNFKVTDNGIAQQISHFDLGGDPTCNGAVDIVRRRIRKFRC